MTLFSKTALATLAMSAAFSISIPATVMAQVAGESLRTERDRRPPPRGERPPKPVDFSYDNPNCAVTFQRDYCLGEAIDSQLSRTPMDKLGSYGLRDVYQKEEQRGIVTTLYVVDNKLANVLVRFPSQALDKRRRGHHRPRGSEPGRNRGYDRPEHRGGPGKGPLRPIFRIADGFAAQTGHDKGREAMEQVLSDIEQKGQGGHTWQMKGWSFYTELSATGSILAEAWLPELEQKEKSAKVLKGGDVLSGLWHNKYPVEVSLTEGLTGQFKGVMKFTGKDSRKNNSVNIKQLSNNQLELTQTLDNGQIQSLTTERPKGDSNKCYVWELRLEDKIDGMLKLCH